MVSEDFPSSRAFVAGSRVAGYVLEEQIGQGGMAVVFRAHDERLDRTVALKILAPRLARDQVFRQRFMRESRAAAAVDDPHIIPVFEAGEANGVLFIVMRFVRGGDVRSLVDRFGRLPPGRRRTSSRRWRRPWTRRIMPGSCTETSSPPTCCSTGGPGAPITCTCRISG
jgi:serine/threonine protein kinase